MWVLLILHPTILGNHSTIVGPHKEIREMALGRTTVQSLRNPQVTDVCRTSSETTKL